MHVIKPMILRASEADSELFFELRNASDTVRLSKTKTAIIWDDHVHWFKVALSCPNYFLYVALSSKDKIGYVRFHLVNDHAIVSIALKAMYQGKGISKLVLEKAITELCHSSKPNYIDAEVNKDNIASQRLFNSIGFKKIKEDGDYFIYEKKL